MNKKQVQLVMRREQLIDMAAMQRAELGQLIEPWRAPLARLDQGLNVIRYFKRHPSLILISGLALAALRPGRLGAGEWLRRGWLAWRVVRHWRSNKR